MPHFTTFFDATFLIGVVPIVVILCSLVPQKARRWVLLIASYIVFWAFSAQLIVYLLLSTLLVHYFGLWLSKVQGNEKLELDIIPKENRDERKIIKKKYQREQGYIMAFAVVIHVGILFVLKYSPFFAENLNSLFDILGVGVTLTIPKFVLPIGISFYTMQAVSYIFDVYRKKIPADENILRLALFMSFFPQIMEGPICRYSETAMQIYDAPKPKFENVISGAQRIAFGLLKKLVLADRLNLFIQNVFDSYAEYDGLVIALSAILYTIQLYADFSGTMDLVIGTAEMLGITMPENFKRPFFSRNISEFWMRWHITLGAWFKDYIFYPMSMSKPLKKLTSFGRKKLGNHFGPLLSGAIALFCVWLCNGLWHGAGWNYIFFGMYHFVLILMGNIFDPYFAKLSNACHIDRNSFVYRCFQIVRTTLLVCIGEMFFRASDLQSGFVMFKKIFTEFSFSSITNGTVISLGLDIQDYVIILVTVILLFVIGIINEKGISIRAEVSKKNIFLRFLFYYLIIVYIVVFGAYGAAYVPVDPMYAAF